VGVADFEEAQFCIFGVVLGKVCGYLFHKGPLIRVHALQRIFTRIPALASQCACVVRECAWTPFLCARQGAAARDADLARGELAQMTIQAGMALGLLAKAQADVTQLAVHVQGVVEILRFVSDLKRRLHHHHHNHHHHLLLLLLLHHHHHHLLLLLLFLLENLPTLWSHRRFPPIGQPTCPYGARMLRMYRGAPALGKVGQILCGAPREDLIRIHSSLS
jgi:hypothetical protein